MKRFVSLFSGLLVAILLFTSQQMAMARGEMRNAAGEIVLCQGGVAVSVAVDASGNPVGPAHFCPDCVSGFFVDLASSEPSCAPAEWLVASEFNIAIKAATSFERGLKAARGPPLVI